MSERFDSGRRICPHNSSWHRIYTTWINGLRWTSRIFGLTVSNINAGRTWPNICSVGDTFVYVRIQTVVSPRGLRSVHGKKETIDKPTT